MEESGSFVPIPQGISILVLAPSQNSFLTNMGVIAVLGEIRVKGDTMVTQMQQFLCQRIELGFDKLDFFVDLAMLSAKMMSSLFLKIVNLSHCLELEKDVNHVPNSQIRRRLTCSAEPWM